MHCTYGKKCLEQALSRKNVEVDLMPTVQLDSGLWQSQLLAFFRLARIDVCFVVPRKIFIVNFATWINEMFFGSFSNMCNA